MVNLTRTLQFLFFFIFFVLFCFFCNEEGWLSELVSFSEVNRQIWYPLLSGQRKQHAITFGCSQWKPWGEGIYILWLTTGTCVNVSVSFVYHHHHHLHRQGGTTAQILLTLSLSPSVSIGDHSFRRHSVSPTTLINVRFCWSANTGVSIAYEFALSFPLVRYMAPMYTETPYIYTRDLFIVVIVCAEPASLFGRADNRLNVHLCATNFTSDTSQLLKSVFYSLTPVAQTRQIYAFHKGIPRITNRISRSYRYWNTFLLLHEWKAFLL